MDKNEAKLVLQACRPNGEDATRPVFSDAIALAEQDPELKAWWEARQSFDRNMSAKLKEIPLPADLRATIMAGRKIEQMTPRFRMPLWLAAAAVITLLVVAGSMLRSNAGATLASADYRASVFAFMGDDSPSLGTTSENQAKLVAWLKEKNSPTGTVPASMAGLPSVGCQTFQVKGHAVSLICFQVTGGVVHLVIVDKNALGDPPGASPEFAQNGNWSTAAWSDNEKSYMLMTEESPETLKRLL